MKLTGFRLLAVSSLLLTAHAASAATRPHYGGTLHVGIQSGVTSLDPANEASTSGATNVLALIFDTLVSLDERGQPAPALATAWQAAPGNQRWQFSLRGGVSFSDGTPLTPEAAAAALRRANPPWKVVAGEGTITIERDAPTTDLPAELSLLRNSIAKIENARIMGTGPFAVSRWDPGKTLVVTARDDYWGGRPFLDSIEIEIAKSFRDQIISFDLGQSQLIQIPPEQAQHAATQARQLRVSAPVELVALAFARDPQTPQDVKQREVLALSIDRSLLNSVVLQGAGEPAGGLLPNGITGYGFLFPVNADLTHAQQLRAEIPQTSLWTLGFNASDPLARVLADRIVLNASDAGLRVQLANKAAPDIQLVRVPLASLDSHIALAELAKSLGVPAPRLAGDSAEELYHAESVMLQSQRVIPLLHLRMAWAVSTSVKGWGENRGGTWRLPDAWLAKP
jgi:peptide/nickel transport system substrate-binding protein